MTASLQAFQSQIDVFVARNLAPEQISRTLASHAKDWLAEAIRSGKAPPTYRRFVNGQEGAAEETVKPDGWIVYRFNILPEVILFALAFLQARSPAKSGRYQRSFFVGVNGRKVPAGQFRPQFVPPKAEIYIGNDQPYSRKLDVQLIGKRWIRVPGVSPGIFEDAAVAVRRRYGTLVTCERRYTIQYPGQYPLKTGPNAGKPVHSPALHITSRS